MSAEIEENDDRPEFTVILSTPGPARINDGGFVAMCGWRRHHYPRRGWRVVEVRHGQQIDGFQASQFCQLCAGTVEGPAFEMTHRALSARLLVCRECRLGREGPEPVRGVITLHDPDLRGIALEAQRYSKTDRIYRSLERSKMLRLKRWKKTDIGFRYYDKEDPDLDTYFDVWKDPLEGGWMWYGHWADSTEEAGGPAETMRAAIEQIAREIAHQASR